MVVLINLVEFRFHGIQLRLGVCKFNRFVNCSPVLFMQQIFSSFIRVRRVFGVWFSALFTSDVLFGAKRKPTLGCIVGCSF